MAYSRTRTERRQLGQYFTPPAVAAFMASLFSDEACSRETVRVLDAGAGEGRLTEALVARLLSGPRRPREILSAVWEMDAAVLPALRETLDRCRERCAARGVAFTAELHTGNFILEGAERATPGLFAGEVPAFDLAIVNPPYRKLSSDSAERAALSALGLETSNLYTAFLGLITRLLRPGGELSAITPRSFCNGAYFRPFRRDFLQRMAVNRLHLIDSRTKTFSADAVLQETLIFHAVRDGGVPETVGLSESPGAPTGAEPVRRVPWSEIVRPGDSESFIHLPTEGAAEAETMAAMPLSLAELGLEVSTGRVVAFRSTSWLHASPKGDDAPLLWATHLDGRGGVRWPLGVAKRPEALARCAATAPMILPSGRYVVVKRLTAKEEKRRVVASVVDSQKLGGGGVAFENHLNFFHVKGRGLDAALANKLCDYLNSGFVDRWFRLFNGHTQVNATDLRVMRFPDFGAKFTYAYPCSEDNFTLNEDPPMKPKSKLAAAKSRIAEARELLGKLGFSGRQSNELAARTFLALLGLPLREAWANASGNPLTIREIIDFIGVNYPPRPAENTRETVRDEVVKHFVAHGLLIRNADDALRPTNSSKTNYRLSPDALHVCRTNDSDGFEKALKKFLSVADGVRAELNRVRDLARIPVKTSAGEVFLSPGGQSPIIKAVIEEFGPRFVPEATLLYVGDTATKFTHYDTATFAKLGLVFDPSEKMPDVVFHDAKRGWLVLVEAVSSDGAVDGKRRMELKRIFRTKSAGLVFVTAFADRANLRKHLADIAWETEVWLADAPDHMIHLNGERFLGPYDDVKARG